MNVRRESPKRSLRSADSSFDDAENLFGMRQQIFEIGDALFDFGEFVENLFAFQGSQPP